MRPRFQIGDVVDYHAVIDGPVTSRGHVVTALGSLPSGRPVAWITGKARCVTLEALSLVSRPIEGA